MRAILFPVYYLTILSTLKHSSTCLSPPTPLQQLLSGGLPKSLFNVSTDISYYTKITENITFGNQHNISNR